MNISKIILYVMLFCCMANHLNAQTGKSDQKSPVNPADSIREFMLRGAVMSLAAVQSKYESLEAGNSGNQILSRQKSGEAQNYFNQSRAFYRKALVYDSIYAAAWNSLGTTYFLQDLPEQSLPFYRRAVVLQPSYGVAIVNMGKAFVKMNTIDSALYCYQWAIRVDSTLIQAYVEQARLQISNRKDNQAALEILRVSTHYCGQNETPYLMISEIHLANGDSVNAMLALENAARLNQGNTDRLLLLASWFERHGDLLKAKELRALAEAEIKRSNPDK